MKGFKIYSTLEPCLFCYCAISMYFLNTIYFGAYDNKNLGITTGADLFCHDFKGYKPSVYGGIGEEQFSKLLKRFFKKLR